MRVGVVVEQALAPVPGGIGRYAVELARALVRSAAPGDTVTGWTAWHRDLARATVAGVAGPRRLALPGRMLPLAWERGTGPRPRDCDLVHAPSLLFPPRRGPLVVSVHDTVPWTHPETLTEHGARWHRTMAERAVAAGATLTTLTQVVADELPSLLPGLRPDRIRVLGAGVTEAVVRDPGAEAVAEAGRRYALPERFVLSVSTLEPRKGLDVLIGALAGLGEDGAPLVVVGPPGWGGVDVADLADRAGLRQVRALGRIGDDDLAAVLRLATVLAAPSRSEGFGLPVVEAMAAGVPVVVSDVPSLVEVVSGAGVVTPVGDSAALAAALGDLLADPARRSELAAAGRERAARHTWAAVAGRAWALYRSLAG